MATSAGHEPLRDPRFRRLFAAQLVSLLGTGLTTVALGLLTLDIAGAQAGAVLGTALAIKMVAYVAVSPIAAVVAARLPRRFVLVGSNLVRAGAVLCFPLVSEVWHVYVLVAVMQSASAVFTPAFQATLPDVLAEEGTYTRALSYARLSYDLETLLSPVIAGALLTLLTFDSLFMGTAIGFVLSSLLVLSTPLPIATRPHSGVRAMVAESVIGIRRFFAVVELRALMALNMVVAAGSSTVLVNTPVLVGELLGRSERDIAFTLAAYGAGSMLVAIALGRLLRSGSERPLMLAAAVVLPAVVVLTAIVAAGVEGAFGDHAGAGWGIVLATWFAAGCGTSAILTPTGRLLRRASTTSDRTEVFAAQFSLSHACFLITYPVAGWVSALAGIGWSAATLAVLCVVGSLAAFRLWR